MVGKESQSISALSEFLEWAAQFNDEEYLFRGVEDETYRIQASASRRLTGVDRHNPHRLLRITEQLIEDAKRRGHDQKDGRPLWDLEMLAELQHFGAATCLIDFTRSALVALWFACENGSEDENGANGKVFAVRRDISLKTVTSDLIQKPIEHFFRVDRETPYQLYQWEPKLQNNRIVAQHSVFVFGGAEVEVEATCVILAGSKRSILKSLKEASDITEVTMYPDFDGFARLHAHDRPHAERDAWTYLQRGIDLHQRDDLYAAIAYYNEIISSDFANTSAVAYAYNNRGVAYATMGEYNRAIADLTKSVELRPSDPESHANRGAAYAKYEKYELAIEDYNKAINFNLHNAELYSVRGTIYAEMGEYVLAAEDLNKAIELNPNDAGAYNARGYTHFRNGDFDSAITDYNRSIHLNSDFAETYCNRGEAWLHLKDWEKAKSDLIIARDKRLDIIASFRKDYESVEDFEQKNSAKLPEDIAAMLTPSAD